MKPISIIISNEDDETQLEDNNTRRIDDLNLIYELDYLGHLEIESKYLQSSILPWLISTLRLIETDQHVDSIHFKINSKNNSLIACKSSEDEISEDTTLFTHKLTNISYFL